MLPDLHGSDYFPIAITSADGEPHARLPRWGIDRADWQLVTELCSIDRSVDDFGSTDEAVTYIMGVIHSAAVVSIPKTSDNFPRCPVP